MGRLSSPRKPQSKAKKNKSSSSRSNRFSAYWFFLVFWLTVLATVLISWQMILARGAEVVDF